MSEMNETLPRLGQVGDESIAFTTALSYMRCVSTIVPIIFRIKSMVKMKSGQLSVGHLNITTNKAHSKLTSTVHLWCFSGS